LLKITNGKLHTNDRTNYKAMSEVVQKLKGETEENEKKVELDKLWEEKVRINFDMDFWPYIRSNQTKTCVDIVMENSPANLLKLIGASHLVFSVAALAFV